MTYVDMPLIIPLLAAGYLLTIYGLLSLAQRTAKPKQYLASQLGEVAYLNLSSYLQEEAPTQNFEDVSAASEAFPQELSMDN